MRCLLVAVGFLACALAGCSGSGGTANAVSPPAPTATPSPSPTPNPHPAVDGATVTFTADETIVDTPAGGQPTSSSFTATVTETVHTSATFNGHAATDVHTASSDGNFNQDNYEGYVATSSGQNYVQYGQTVAYTKEKISETSLLPDPLIADEIPEITGASWTNSNAINFSASRGPANQHVDETEVRHNDGSDVHTYTHTDGNAADTYTNTFTTNANGSGSVAHQAPTGSYTYSIGVPVQQGGAFVIPITYTDQSGPQSYTVPDWYPGNGVPAAPFASLSATNLGVQTPPPACSKGPQISASHVRLSQTSLGLLSGTETLVEDFYYTASMGLICYTSTDTVKFYDYLDTGALTDTGTDSIVYTLTSGVGITSGGRRPSSMGLPYGFLRRPSRLLHDVAFPRRASKHR